MNQIENISSQRSPRLHAWQEMVANGKRPHLSFTSNINTDDLECLKVQAVAEIMAVSTDTVRRLIKKEKLKAVKVGKSVRILRWSIDEYMRTHIIEAQSPPEEKQSRRRTSNGAGYRAALKKAQDLGINL
jgi:excisionase family DNA binding protein